MAIFRREFIAVPDDKKDQIVFKWPDVNIRRFTRAIVAPDEVAVFLYQGQVVGTLPPGRHQVDATEIPFLGAFADAASGGNMYRVELYFVSSRQISDRFGGRVDEVQDPQTGLLVTLRVFGEYILQVTDPVKLITRYSGTQDVPDNARITALTEDMILRGLRTDLTRNVVRNGWPVLGLAAYTDAIEGFAVTGANALLGDYGVGVVRMQNFTISLDDETEAELRRLAKDTAYSRLAGGFQQYAAGELALGAGEGMAKGGGGTQGAFLGAGLGLGGVAAQQPQQPGPPPPPAPGFAGGGPGYTPPAGPGQAVTCPRCQTQNAPGARFCASCGTPLAPPSVECPSCHAQNSAGARFCSACGTALAPAATTCASCGTALAPGARFCPSCGAAVDAGAPPADASPPEAGSGQPPPAPPAPPAS